MRPPRAHIGLALGALLVACACGASAPVPDALHDDSVTVGSFDFTESELVAELYAQALEARGISVVRQFDVGPRELVLPALQRGLLEVVPEYEGSALTFLGGDATSDPRVTQDGLVRILRSHQLVPLRPSRAQDRNGFVVTAATAQRLGVRTLSDLAPLAPALRLGGPAECPERPLCLLGLERVYGLHFAEFVPLDSGGPLTIQALDAGIVDVALLFTTDGRLAGRDLVLLEDDRSLQPSERLVPVLHPEVQQRFGPEVEAALDAVSRALTTENLRTMNADVAAGQALQTVASDWLSSHGIAPSD